MKWVLMTRDEAERSVGSFVVEAAILVIEMEEVFVARIAWEGHIWASWENIFAFNSGISCLELAQHTRISAPERTGTASITKSTSERSSMEVLEVNLPLVASASSFDILCLPTSFSRSLSANFRPLSIDACELSISLTGTEALCAATRAIPRPCTSQLAIPIDISRVQTIWPAPMTPSFFTSAAAPTEGEELKLRHWRLATHLSACLEADEKDIVSLNCEEGKVTLCACEARDEGH
jgi:hypothetical protein